MRFTLRGRLDDEKEFALSRRLAALRMAREAVRKVSLAVERKVKDAMPVDTGRARASWGHWFPGALRRGVKEASPADAIWETEDQGLTQVQGSNVPYIEDLNMGTSQQAPAGFIDAAAEAGMRALDDEIDFIMRAF
jgi:hypothetical protein